MSNFIQIGEHNLVNAAHIINIQVVADNKNIPPYKIIINTTGHAEACLPFTELKECERFYEDFKKILMPRSTMAQYLIDNNEGITEYNIQDFIEYLIDNDMFAEQVSLFADEFLKNNS